MSKPKSIGDRGGVVTTVARGKIRPIRDHILVTDMKFDQRKTKGGILLLDDDGKSEGIRPRWAKIHAVGPEQKEFQVGDWILVSHGRWTRGLEYVEDGAEESVTVRRVDVKDIMAIADEKPNDCDL